LQEFQAFLQARILQHDKTIDSYISYIGFVNYRSLILFKLLLIEKIAHN